MNQHIARAEVDRSTALTGSEAKGVAPEVFDPERIREAVATSTDAPRFLLEPLDEIFLDRKPQWLIAGLMPSRGLHVLYGAPGSGKSFLALDVALHVAAGKAWGGRPVEKGGVVYVAAEGREGFRKRVVAARAALGDVEDVRFALVTTAPDLGRDGDTAELIKQIRAQTRSLGWEPRLVVIDTLSRSVADMNESSSQDVMCFVANAERISEEFGCVVMPVHHTGKDESKGMRGSSALHGSADAEWLVSRPEDDGPRHVSVEKMKDGEDKLRLRYDLVKVDLGPDLANQMITTRVAKVFEASDDAGSATRDTKTKGRFSQEDVVVTILKLLAATGEQRAPEGSQLGKGKVVHRKAFEAAVASAEVFAALSPDAIRTATNRAIKTLIGKDELAKDDKLLCVLDRVAAQ